MSTAATDDPAAPLSAFREQGYAVVRHALTDAEVERLRVEAVAVCRGDRGVIKGASPAAADASDEAVIDRYLAIDNPHKVSVLLSETLRHPRVVEALTDVIGPDVKAMQSILFIKSPGRPGQAWHQDESFIPTRDRSLTGAWIALDDATVDNGCLWMIPGSHTPGVLYPTRPHRDPRFDASKEAYGFGSLAAGAMPVPVRSGSVVLFNGYLLHRSLPNRSRGSRRALVNHYMSAQSLLPWKAVPAGHAIGTHDYRDIVMVAGRDPYASKGLADLTHAEIWPARTGVEG
jgi:phytanoyl-CoA hydroxylase